MVTQKTSKELPKENGSQQLLTKKRKSTQASLIKTIKTKLKTIFYLQKVILLKLKETMQ
jgi:hypothetical protein